MLSHKYILVVVLATINLWAEPTKEERYDDGRNVVYLVPNFFGIYQNLDHRKYIPHLKKIVKEIKPDILCVELNPADVKRWRVRRRTLKYSRPEYTKGYMKWQKRYDYLVYPAVPKKEVWPTKVVKQDDYLTPERVKNRYAMIEKVLNAHQGEGRSIIISHGLGWFKKFAPLIQKRGDLVVIDLTERIEREARELKKSQALKKR